MVELGHLLLPWVAGAGSSPAGQSMQNRPSLMGPSPTQSTPPLQGAVLAAGCGAPLCVAAVKERDGSVVEDLPQGLQLEVSMLPGN